MLVLAWIWRTSDQDVHSVDQQSRGASGNGFILKPGNMPQFGSDNRNQTLGTRTGWEGMDRRHGLS
jgi:hypothetical protein